MSETVTDTPSTPPPAAPPAPPGGKPPARARTRAGNVADGVAVIQAHLRTLPSSPGVYRMLDEAGAHPAHDRGHRDRRDHLDRDRNRGAAARSQSDQAAAPALQRATARRQIVSLYPDHRRSLGAADPQASRRAVAARALFRAVRLGRRGQPHHHGAAARLPGALLHRPVFSKAAPGPACCIKSGAAPGPAPARSIFPAIPSWCARRRISCPAAAAR
jgi:hypothetical protein